MENDQFGGRTDDDLFADDFEPVPQDQQEVIISTPIAEPSQIQDAPSTTPVPSATQAPQAPKSLANSRHNKPPRGPKRDNKSHNTTSTAEPPTSTSPPPPTAPKEPAAARESGTGAGAIGRNTASVNSESRIGSGVNPRKKPTEEELAAKMEKMRILNEEKTRKFEKAQRDEVEHAAAYAKGMEEARRRKAEEDKRRKAEEEKTRRLDDERAKNRERKLAAMGMKEGGWDEGKEERLAEEERRGFRGANGGIRGFKSGGGGLGSSRYADGNGEDRFGDSGGSDRDRGGYRGRGGGRGGRGRGGGRGGKGGHHRGLFDATDGEDRDRDRDNGGGYFYGQNKGNNNNYHNERAKEGNKPRLAAEDFPALPGSSTSGANNTNPAKIDTKPPGAGTYAKPVVFSPLSPLGKWDEEVAAMDDNNKTEGKT